MMNQPSNSPQHIDHDRVLLIVADGLGFDRDRSRKVLEATWASLASVDKKLILAQAESALAHHTDCQLTADELAIDSLAPIFAEMLASETATTEALGVLAALASMRSASEGTPLRERIEERLSQIALRQRYVPWVAQTPRLNQFRNSHLTVPTSAAGKWAGFEDVVPPVQGNSETGHQQIGSFSMAPQTPLEITESIRNGDFFKNPALLDALRPALNGTGKLNFCFMLSGTGGSDGRVHSAWNHLEAFLELVFERAKVSPERVRMQAVLDGRDGYQRGSIEKAPDGTGNYLELLELLLSKYDASECLAWVVGRAFAMDRDYRESAARADYDLLTSGNGEVVTDFSSLRRAIERAHSRGLTDQDVPPIVVTGSSNNVPVLESGDSFVNLNFRSDRQRAKTATLVGATQFLARESASRGREWKMDWLKSDLHLRYCCIAQYDPALDKMPGVSVAFPVSPLPATLLELWPLVMDHWKYVLVGESVKASHVGYFLRGRREQPVSAESEVRWVTPSAGEAEGVRSDSDFYLHPEMRMGEVTEHVIACMSDNSNRLIACNLAAPDMIGHLLPARFESAVAACEATDKAIGRMTRAALSNGFSVILTADHGNIEDDGPSHTANDVLTTVASPGAPYRFSERAVYQARIFDMSMTIAHILGFKREAEEFQARSPYQGDSPFAGRPIIG